MLLAVYDEDDDVFRSIRRCMTFTDAMYDATREFYFRATPYPSKESKEKCPLSAAAAAGGGESFISPPVCAFPANIYIYIYIPFPFLFWIIICSYYTAVCGARTASPLYFIISCCGFHGFFLGGRRD